MIEIVCGDITKLQVDIIVNAANETLLGGGGVDGAIHARAGPQLSTVCRELGGCPTGEARITPGYRLAASWIVHTVGPIWDGGTRGEAELLHRCYRNSFKLAGTKTARSIAFPAISTGVYGYPIEQAARIALTEMQAFETLFETVIACCFSRSDADVYEAVIADLR